ncbi:MAG: hypothetical protein ACI87J_002242 [Colwellia sp.]|jgi:hypothetical protein
MEALEKLQTGKEAVALRLYTLPEEYGTGITVHADVVYVKNAKIDYVQSMGFYNNYFDEKHQYKGLSVIALCYGEKPTPTGYELHIESSRNNSITLEKALSMVSVLKPINRKMSKLDLQLGPHENYAEYVHRIAIVLKVKSFYHKSIKSTNDFTEYRVDDITQLKQAIEQMLEFNVKSSVVA